MASTDRIDTVTGVHYIDRVTDPKSGMTSYFSRTPDGKPLGTVFRWNGKWNSAYNEDGKHRSLRALSKQMMARKAMEDLDRLIQQWVTENKRTAVVALATLTNRGTPADDGASAMLSQAIMNLKPVTAP